jgi:hypothetical protein
MRESNKYLKFYILYLFTDAYIILPYFKLEINYRNSYLFFSIRAKSLFSQTVSFNRHRSTKKPSLYYITKTGCRRSLVHQYPDTIFYLTVYLKP